jgi:hypothetical protein
MDCDRKIMHDHKCKASSVWILLMFVLTSADDLRYVWFIYRVLC